MADHTQVSAAALPVSGEKPGDIKLDSLLGALSRKSDRVKGRLDELSAREDSVNVIDMLKMQMDMNNFMHLIETASNFQYASHQACSSVTRNIK